MAETKPRNTAAIVAAVLLLLLPVLYVGSYLALAEPGATFYVSNLANGDKAQRLSGYRVYPTSCEHIFYPLEQIDRRVRPGAWESAMDRILPEAKRKASCTRR